ncbi:MAG: thymidylate kinase [Eubacteriales bacterium]|jgi:dTMP kinase|nr:thymidylate kinase [Eubacteriales bacterium]
MLVVIEGVDGSGKQTQTAKLYERLLKEGRDVRKIQFPNYESETSALVKMYLGGVFGDKPEDVNPYVASSFYAVDRIGSYLMDWKKDYEKGTLILSDRYTTSNAVHQAGKLPGGARDGFLDWLFDYEYRLLSLPKPDLVIFLDMPFEHGRRLISNRSNKITGGMQKDIHENDAMHIQSAYENALYVAKKYGWKIISCVEDGKVRSIDSIHQEIYSLI